MSSNYVCPHCENHFATRQSVWKHKHRCKVRRDGGGFMFTQASNGVVPTKTHVQPKSEPLDDNASSVSSEESTIADIV